MLLLSLLCFFQVATLPPDCSRPHIYFQRNDYPREVYQLVEFYAQHFEFDESVHIHIDLRHKFPANLAGYIVYHKDEEKNTHNIFIKIRKNLNSVQRRKAIAHEMVHAKQYVTQELQVIDGCKVLWKEKVIPDYRNIEYKEREWEHEAFFQTSYLVRLFNQSQLN